MKKFIPKLKNYVWISLACVVAFCICLGLFVNTVNTLGSLNAAKVWRGENPMNFAQMAVFFPESNKIDEDSLQSFFKTAEEKL